MSFVGVAIAAGLGAGASTIVGAGALGLGALTTGLSMGGVGQPSQPNLTASSAEMARVQAELLPILRQMQAQAQLGGSVLNPGYADVNGTYYQLKTGCYQAGTDANGNPIYYGANGKVISFEKAVKSMTPVPESQAMTNYAGMSEADIQGTIMKKLAEGQIADAQKYDSQFIASALAQEEQANPQGVEARKMLYDDIQKQIKNPPVSPVSNEIQRQVSEKVAAGSGLTAEEQQMLDASIKERGGTTPGADFSSPLTTGQAGFKREMANAGAGTSWLSSGQTPEDIQYRSDQQNLSNLAAYISGQTPQSQFKELSGAQSGPTPNYTGTTPLPSSNTGAGAQGASAAVTGYGQQVKAALNSVNPWIAGLSGVLGAANTAGAAGYKPLAA